MSKRSLFRHYLRRVVVSCLLLAVLLVCSSWLLTTRLRTHRRAPTFADNPTRHRVGVVHVHSSASHDGSMSLSDIAFAAKKIGADFVIVTDHNVQAHNEAMWINGVLLLFHAELSTPMGHVIQLGLSEVPDHTMRERPDILGVIAAQGGHAIVAHPGDKKRPWTGPMDGAAGMELANVSSSARALAWTSDPDLLSMLLAYPMDKRLSLLLLYRKDSALFKQWDTHPDVHFIGLCGSDTHGHIDIQHNMRTWYVMLDAVDEIPWHEGAAPQATASYLLEEITQGRFYCVAGLLGRSPIFGLMAENDFQKISRPGDSVKSTDIDAIRVEGPMLSVSGSNNYRQELVLIKDGVDLVKTQDQTLRYVHPSPGLYRAELRFGYDTDDTPHREPSMSNLAIFSNRLQVSP